MSAVFHLFDWLPGGLRALMVGAVVLFLLVSLARLFSMILELLQNLFHWW